MRSSDPCWDVVDMKLQCPHCKQTYHHIADPFSVRVYQGTVYANYYCQCCSKPHVEEMGEVRRLIPMFREARE